MWSNTHVAKNLVFEIISQSRADKCSSTIRKSILKYKLKSHWSPHPKKLTDKRVSRRSSLGPDQINGPLASQRSLNKDAAQWWNLLKEVRYPLFAEHMFPNYLSLDRQRTIYLIWTSRRSPSHPGIYPSASSDEEINETWFCIVI